MEDSSNIEYKIEDAEANSTNKEFMLKAIENNAPWVIAYADEKLLDDKELMLKAVKVDGQNLYYASSNLRDDKEVVLAAIENKWLIVKYASKRLRSDKDIAKKVLEKSLDAKIYLTDKILEDEEIKKMFEDNKNEQN